MYLCYIDESGDPGVHPGSPTSTYTVAAVFVHASHWVSVFEDMIQFRRYLSQNFALRMRQEIKANELIRGARAPHPVLEDVVGVEYAPAAGHLQQRRAETRGGIGPSRRACRGLSG
jgi:hypothetical protein